MSEYQIWSVTGLQSTAEDQVVTLFKWETHSTKFWNPVHFAIYKKNLDLVKQILSQPHENPRLATKLDSEGLIDPIEAEAFPLILACSNEDLSMFKYFWEMHYLWNMLHLNVVLEVIFIKTSWKDVLNYLFDTKVTTDIFFSMNFKSWEMFVQELFRRFIANAPEWMIDGLFWKVLRTPFAIIGMKGLLEAAQFS